MRILFVSQEMPPETGWGGIGTYVDVLSEALAAIGVEVHILSAVEGQPMSRTQAGGVTVHRYGLPTVPRPSRHAPESWHRAVLAASVARLIPKLDVEPDVIECPEWMAEGLGLAFQRRVPLVVRLHSTARQIFKFSGQGGHLRGFDGRFAKWLEETSARRANVVISTRANLDEVTGWMRLDQRALHAIPYPVRLPQASPMADAGPPRVTFVGRLEPRKGPEIVLRAAPAILAAVPDARFTFVGRDMVAPGAMPSTKWMLQEADRLGVAHAVELTGQLGRDGVEDQLERDRVCVPVELGELWQCCRGGLSRRTPGRRVEDSGVRRRGGGRRHRADGPTRRHRRLGRRAGRIAARSRAGARDGGRGPDHIARISDRPAWLI